ncbi:uncharacterized protein LOC143445274 [Clavelina lepadiformis]|uniref:Fibroblast growth factor n=1 Tax=Clavelina lepadiformis TaxID=159417 RepID=A0ABP0FE62_CLALP
MYDQSDMSKTVTFSRVGGVSRKKNQLYCHHSTTKGEKMPSGGSPSDRKADDSICSLDPSFTEEVQKDVIQIRFASEEVDEKMKRLLCFDIRFLQPNKLFFSTGHTDRNYTRITSVSNSIRGFAPMQNCVSLTYSLIFSLLLVTSTIASPLTGISGSDSGYQATQSPGIISSRSQVNYITATNNNATGNKLHVRVQRDALTPDARDAGTSPQKRDASTYMLHDGYLSLFGKYGFYLEIKKNGKVRSTLRKNSNSVLVMYSIRTGVVAIKGKKSKRYLAMDKSGKLIGMKNYSDLCNFHEELVENLYFIFYQRATVGKKKKYVKENFIAFDKRGRPKRKKVTRNDSAAHFLKTPAKKMKKKKKKTVRRRRPPGARRPAGAKRRSRKGRKRSRNPSKSRRPKP